MGVYDVLTTVETVITANFAAKITEVGTEKSKTLDTTFTFYNRERAESFHKKTLPGVGLWVGSVSTGAARMNAIRNWDVTAVIDYMFKGTKHTTVAEQVELSLDAMFRVIDIMAGTGTVQGAGELPFATEVFSDLGDLLQEAGILGQTGPIFGGFRIMVPVNQKDELSA